MRNLAASSLYLQVTKVHFAILPLLLSPYSNYSMYILLQHGDVGNLVCFILILFPAAVHMKGVLNVQNFLFVSLCY